MEVTIQYFDGCASWKLAEQRMKCVLRALGQQLAVTHQVIDSPAAARLARFRGSPAILIDGSDPFAGDDQAFGLSCRLYQTDAGLQGAPSEAQLTAVLWRSL